MDNSLLAVRDINHKYIVVDKEETYVYNSLTGAFIEKTYAEKLGILDLRDKWEELHKEDLEKAAGLGYAFDNYNVYRTDANGNITSYIVEKPAWYILTSSIWGFFIALTGALGLAAVKLLSKFRQLNRIPGNKNRIRKKARGLIIYLKTLFSCMLIYSVLNVTLAFFDAAFIMTGIFPVTAVFIISLIVFDKLNKHFSNAEKKVCGMWRLYNILMYVNAMISVIIAICISG